VGDWLETFASFLVAAPDRPAAITAVVRASPGAVCRRQVDPADYVGSVRGREARELTLSAARWNSIARARERVRRRTVEIEEDVRPRASRS
jgi:hypothetical protein